MVKGRVQGVGYRWFALNIANELGISGYVKNRLNGDVEVFAEGEESDLFRFIDHLKEGPPFSKVIDIIIDYTDLKNSFNEFKVKY